MGDFNEILDAEESSCFESLGRLPRGMRDFQRMVLHCKLTDMGDILHISNVLSIHPCAF